MTRAERIEQLKEQVREANRLLNDIAQLDEMIAFIADYGGEDDYHPMQLQLRAFYYPDDCLTNPDVETEKAAYNDESFSLATFMQDKLIDMLTSYRAVLECRLEQVATGQANDQE